MKILLSLGFEKRDIEGSHIMLYHLDGRRTVISIHNRDLSKELIRKILNDINLSVEEYDKLRKHKKLIYINSVKNKIPSTFCESYRNGLPKSVL